MYMEKLLRIEEVAVLVNVSVKSINEWYVFKRTEPENEYAKLLPDPIFDNRGRRLWREADIDKFIKFHNEIPKGRNGIMGKVTQRYYKNRGRKDGKKTSNN